VIAVVPVRQGELPVGCDEAVAEAGGRALLVGSGTAAAAEALGATAAEVGLVEAGSFAPAGWAALRAGPRTGESPIVLPASPDGRDLAPRLAHALSRPLLAGAVQVTDRGAQVARCGGLVLERLAVDGPFVATLVPGARGVGSPGSTGPVAAGAGRPAMDAVPLPLGTAEPPPVAADPVVLEVLPADPATMDLAEASRIVAAGAGLGSAAAVDRLARVGTALGAAMGATRVVTDLGWLSADRQIGTTGVEVRPQLYVAFGISGAVQHVSGLGQPEHVVSVNTDPACPMSARAHLAVVADAAATVVALARLLDVEP
jgi:electron transfer flavoprotein alpha subunit